MTTTRRARRGNWRGRSVRLFAIVTAGAIALASCSRDDSPDAAVVSSAPLPAGGSSSSAASAAGPASASTTASAAGAPADAARVPAGSALPSDAECASRVTPAKEIRAGNAAFNQRRGTQKNLAGDYLARVTGDFSGTTDEIIQWVACKWGIDADVVRAQAARESYWVMAARGDWATDPAACPPEHALGKDGLDGQCPESYGLVQVRWAYHGPPAGLDTWPDAETSTAYNADYTYAVWRTCYEGGYPWLNDVEHTGTYAAGDAWGCIGVWFSGRWRTEPAQQYIADVKKLLEQRVWTTSEFINYR